ncbi:FAD-dependent oxidoreductase [Actinomycetospora endophytica]|uniref:FAD-dependent oxidoreductase n=1 Tax=Actinomycetospora endophytica TaxID=2291215 RepID=A0ABS8PAL9_9PSEU|nr:lycopene cyclase family protein [Actinomycetospora endophytica]MCD2195073.1 FAD-dependent oxidoreductase [Actinomycetospora endophytica]
MGPRAGHRGELSPADLLVAGGGPAGWSAARACARRGLDVVLVDPRPDRTWRHTYGAWAHELPRSGPDALPPEVVAAQDVGWAIATRTHRLDDEYAVLDTPALQRALYDDGVRVVRGRVVTAGAGRAVLADGRECRAGLVADATGAPQALSAHRGRGRRAEQTAVGVVVDEATAARVTGGRLLFMDWRPLHGVPGWPTFLYAVPLGGGRVLLEETSLARRPGLPLPDLSERLRRRLLAAGLRGAEIPLDDPARVEHVRFPVDTPDHRPPDGVVALGAAAPLVHPATGFSVARSLRVATRLADACVARSDHPAVIDGSGGAAWARRAVRGGSAGIVHAMRGRGLDVLLRLPPGEVPEFFDRFFSLPTAPRRAYLGADDDVAESLRAMVWVFARLTPRLRGHLIIGSLAGPGPAQRP